MTITIAQTLLGPLTPYERSFIFNKASSPETIIRKIRLQRLRIRIVGTTTH